MKKTILFAALLFTGLYPIKAAVYTVQVANYQFSPSTVNAIVGDSITWVWVSGSHTTTCDPATQTINTLPEGAATWNSVINSSTKTYTYVLTTAGTYNYSCIPHAAFGMVGVINAASVLPVTLLNFTAALNNNNKALLTWTVSNEQNTFVYIVQKSLDGKMFTDIGSVQASGTSALPKTYTYTDDNIGNNRYIYYVLKTVDKDGSSKLSPVTLFTNVNVTGNIIVSMSPNPISSPGHLMLQFNADKPGTMQVQLFTIDGRQITQTSMMAVAGVNGGHIHFSDVPAGMYTLVFTLDGKRETRRLQFQ